MNKAYKRIAWENYPSEKTPVNEANLNRVDVALNTVDDRVVTLDSTKLDKAAAASLLKNVSYDEATGKFTFTYLSGAQAVIDTKLEKLAVNFSYSARDQALYITLDDGTTQTVDLSELITEYEFKESSVIYFTVSDGKVSAQIKDSSITEEKLDPALFADMKKQVAAAGDAASTARNYASTAVTNAGTAKTAADAAAASASAANNYSIQAGKYAGAVQDSMTKSAASAKLAESYAVGGTGTRDGEDTDNAKYYAGLVENSAQTAVTAANNASVAANSARTNYYGAASFKEKAETAAKTAATSASNAANSEAYCASAVEDAKAAAEEAVSVHLDCSSAQGQNLIPYYTVETGILGGLSCTQNSDGSYTVSGTATSTAFVVVNRGQSRHDKIIRSGCIYTLSTNETLPDGVRLVFSRRTSTNATIDEHAVTSDKKVTFSLDDASGWDSSIVFYEIKKGTAVNVTLKPMLEEGMMAHAYQPITIDNVTLWGRVENAVKKSDISSSSAVTESGKYALDAREKNASISGTLAEQIKRKAEKWTVYGVNIISTSAQTMYYAGYYAEICLVIRTVSDNSIVSYILPQPVRIFGKSQITTKYYDASGKYYVTITWNPENGTFTVASNSTAIAYSMFFKSDTVNYAN